MSGRRASRVALLRGAWERSNYRPTSDLPYLDLICQQKKEACAADIFIEAIRYATKKAERFKLEEIYQHLNLNYNQKQILREQIRSGNIFHSTFSLDHLDTDDGGSYVISASVEDRFRLLAYEDLQQARKSACHAWAMAIFSIFVSCTLGGALSIHQSYEQNKSSNATSELLIEAINTTNKTLETIQKEQENKSK